MFGRYILGRRLDHASEQLYESALEVLILGTTPRESRLIQLVISRPWLIAFIDGGLTVLNRTNGLRQRLVLMSAITEASPLYADLFLPVRRGPFYIVRMLCAAVRAAFCGVFGMLIVAFIK